MTWQNPWAWAGLALLALPVLVHLLSRAPADLRQFPTLRFIEASRLPPKRRTRVRDIPLLLVRLGILALAVAALAQPLLQSNDRRSAPARIVRAIVLDTSASMRRPLLAASGSVADSARRVARAIAADASKSVVIATAAVSGALTGAAAWLLQQHGMHELVVVSDFQQGTVDSVALSTLPARYGVRLIRVAGVPIDSSFLVTDAGSGLSVRVVPLADRTRLTLQTAPASDTAANMSRERIIMLGGESERGDAIAALGASIGVLRNAESLENRFYTDAPSVGVPGGADRAGHVRVVYPGFDARRALMTRATMPRTPWMSEMLLALQTNALLREVARESRVATGASVAGANDSPPARNDSASIVVARNAGGEAMVLAAQDGADTGQLLLFVNADAGSLVSAALLGAVTDAIARDQTMTEREPFTTTDQVLQRWSRAASDSNGLKANAAVLDASSTSPIDGGDSDARWLWALSLALLGVEAWMRRTHGEAAGEPG